ncbi:MAG: hypothetical protein KAH57_10780 [Thermoplasmata archaeon]|nr:hypothetical protein [Thermoplasmata archaeon]
MDLEKGNKSEEIPDEDHIMDQGPDEQGFPDIGENDELEVGYPELEGDEGLQKEQGWEDPQEDELPNIEENIDLEYPELGGEEGYEEEEQGWEEEESEGDEQEEEGEDEPLKRGKQKKGPGKIAVIAVVGIMILAAVGVAILVGLTGDDDDGPSLMDRFDNLGNDVPAANPLSARISEVNPSDEWFEIYIEGGATGSVEGWSLTTFDEELIPMPTVSGLDGYDHIMVYTSSGTADLDGSDGEATVYLDLELDILDDQGDEIALFDQEENIIDFVAWGEGNGDTPREGWTNTSYIPSPEEGSSISIQGPDEGSDSYWTQGPPSPLGNSIVRIDLGDEFIHVQNGRAEEVGVDDSYPWNKDIFIKAKSGVPRGHGVDRSDLKDVLEYSSFTYKLLREMGYNLPKFSGEESDGTPYLRIVVTKNGSYEGFYNGTTGEVHVDVGDNKYASKQTVEHEIFHAFQMAQRSDGSYGINPDENNFIDEGMAEFFGRYSTMKNYNISWQEMEEELRDSGSMNLFNMSTDLNFDLFTEWPEDDDALDHYTMSFLFIKFLMDKFGMDVLKKLHDAVKNFDGPNRDGKDEGDVVGKDAVKKATGVDFDDLLMEFMLWRIEGRFEQYKGMKWPGYEVENEHNFTGGQIDDDEMAEPHGTVVNEFIMNGKDGVITLKGETNKTRWGVTVIMVKPDGSKEYKKEKADEGGVISIYIPAGCVKVIVLKTRLDDAEDDFGGFNIRLQGGPVITPAGAQFNMSHIMWDPFPFNFSVIDNLINASLRLQVGNSSTFSNLSLDHLFGPLPERGEVSYPLPLDNGTIWWRYRWESGDHTGPWEGSTNFTKWSGWDDPEIMWDPIPIRYETENGSWIRIIPNTTITFPGYEIPEEIEDEVTSEGVQIRLRGSAPPIDVNWNFSHPFPVGAYVEPGHDTLEWRVFFPPFPDWPWFREDIMWDPTPPTLELLDPAPPARSRENRTARLGVNDSWMVDSFFDVHYGIEEPSKVYTKEPGRVGFDEDMIIYELELNLSELYEGTWTFNISVRDGYGRASNHIEFQIEVDRSAPEFVIETDGAGDPPMFNGPFEITIWTEDETAEDVLLRIIDSGGGITTVDVFLSNPPTTHTREWVGIYDLIEYPLPEGPITIDVLIIDDVGNQRQGSMIGLISLIPPEVVIIEPVEGCSLCVGLCHIVNVDIFEDQTQFITIKEVRVVLRCMENYTEVENVTISWYSYSYYGGFILVPPWASTVVPWRIEVYAVDTAGNVGSATRSVILNDP